MANEDKSARYHRLRRRATLLATAWRAAFLLSVLLSGASTAIAQAVSSIVGPSLVLVAGAFVLTLGAMYGVVAAPLAFYQGVVLERRYGLSTESPARWWADHIKAVALVLVCAVAASLLVLFLIRASPDLWWVAATIAFAALLVLLAAFAPVALLPLFYTVKPLGNEALRARLLALAKRAGAPALDVVEWRVGDRTKKANAALVGIGRTRRILVSDTLLAGHTDDEIEAVLAHELAHHVYGDIWSALALETAFLGVGFYVADMALTIYAAPLGLEGKADVAGLPLVALIGGAVSFALLPAGNALSRAHERRADRFALEVTRNSAAFISAMKRLAARNLAEERPSRLVEFFFHTHPSTADRIEAAKGWVRGPETGAS
jgi:STE24 endopeptidase